MSLRTKERIIDLDNPSYGWDVGYIWTQIGDNLDHPAWEIMSRDAAGYAAVADGMVATFGESTTELSDQLSEEDEDRYYDRLDRLQTEARQIGHEVIERCDTYLYMNIDDISDVEDAVMAGFRAAYLVAKELMPESVE